MLEQSNNEFIVSVFKFFLKRTPDAEGSMIYMEKLNKGVPKWVVLCEILDSTEYKSKNTQLNSSVVKRLIKIYKIRKLIYFIKLGRNKNKISRYKYFNLALNKLNILDKHYLHDRKINDSIDELSIADGNYLIYKIICNLNLGEINSLNPNDFFDDKVSVYESSSRVPPIKKIFISADNKINYLYYANIGLMYEEKGSFDYAKDYYIFSLNFGANLLAYENLGNYYMRNNNMRLAYHYYAQAIQFDNIDNPFLYINFSKVQCFYGDFNGSIDTLCKGFMNFKSYYKFEKELDDVFSKFWEEKFQYLGYLSAINDRSKMILEYDISVDFISNTYSQFFSRLSSSPCKNSLNYKKVLIIGLSFDDAPQCYRYRVDQKIQQLKFSEYVCEFVHWTKTEECLTAINKYDVIIFYRTPAFPYVIKLLEYAKSLGKITYYELDDLLFEEYSVPSFETFGGSISIDAYTSIVRDIGSYRSFASLCDYCIASTQPLLNKLSPLTITKKGYVHRNGIDSYFFINNNNSSNQSRKDVIIFYGSGTLAHNSDFIEDALPSIEKILVEFKFVKLVIMGYLVLPSRFIEAFRDQFLMLPFTKSINVYYEYLSQSSINLAVLHDDSVASCKSELKWFEAAFWGVPSIVSSTQNYMDVIHAGEDGFIVDQPYQWYTFIKLLVLDKELRKKIATNARERVLREYSIDALSRNIDLIVCDAKLDKEKTYGI